jgi:outer membrane protein OmpA-like peptidoglycan-associated protein
MGRFRASASRRDAAWRAAGVIGALLAASASPAAAQTMVLGGSTGPDVIVNESVLDSLGPAPTLPGLMRQENAAGTSPSGLRPFSLHPPRARRTAAVSRPQPSTADQTEPATTASVPAETAIPLGKPRRTAKTTPAAPAAPAAAEIAPASAAPTPPTQPPPKPMQSASLGSSAPPPPAAAAPAPAAPSAPVNSLVRRYPAGTGAAALAAAAPPPQPSAPAPAPSPAPAATAATPSASATTAAPNAPAPSAPPAPAATIAQPGPAPAAAASAPPAPPAAAAPQVANLPPQGALPAQIVFAPNVTDMPDQAKAALDKVVAAMKADDQIRIQLIGYASGQADNAFQARRISLQRAVSVRAYLIGQGVSNIRMDVRALGNRTDIVGPQDRVDVVAIDR